MKNSCLRCGGQIGLEEGLCYRCNIFNRKAPFNKSSYFDEEILWNSSSSSLSFNTLYPFNDLI